MGTFLFSACQNKPTEEEIEIPTCTPDIARIVGHHIPVDAIEIPFSVVKGRLDHFINPCKPVDVNPLTLESSSIRTHHVIYRLNAIYPIDEIKLLTDAAYVSIEVSLDGSSYSRIINQASPDQSPFNLGGRMAKAIRFIFPKTDEHTVLQDIRLTLASGFIIEEDEELTRQFLRYNGWTGADGIFTFNLTDGNETIGAAKSTVGFIFSDTFVGEVYTNNNLRKTSIMINNSLGYMNTSLPLNEALTFEYPILGITPKSPFTPEHYIGLQGRNLLDGDGLSITQSKEARLTHSSEGLGYRANAPQAEIIIDLKGVFSLGSITLWNDNANPNMGTKRLTLSTSTDGQNYTSPTEYILNQASGSQAEPYTADLALDATARFIKLNLIESYDAQVIGLGKVMIFDEDERFLFGSVTSTPSVSTLHANELSARLWLQDGVVLNNKIYLFPILVKDEGEIFKVHNVGLIETPIVGERIIYQDATYHDTPLMVKTQDGGTIYFGAGLLNNVAIDGYVYIYGYKDLHGRHLVVGRFLPEDILNFNAWTYFNGTTFTFDIQDVASLKNQVSAELSVTQIPSGIYEGKYMLVVMENTTSGRISYAISDTPYGTFGDYVQVYQTDVSHLRGAFTYNAKLHPALSKPGELVISYNVNTTQLGALSDARIYYPRFIKIIEVKSE
jgi:hypothetical protein